METNAQLLCNEGQFCQRHLFDFTLLCFQLAVPLDSLVLFWNRFRSHPLARAMDRVQPPVAATKLANLSLKGESFLLHF